MQFPRKLLAAAAMAALAGCDSHDSIRGLNSSQTDDLNAQHSHFEASEDPPLKAQTRYAAGQLAESQGSPSVAIMQYTEALKLDSRHSPSLFRLGVLYAQMKQYPQAIDAWNRYAQLTGKSATGYSNLGFCYELARQPTEAEAAYRKGIERNPTDQPCRVNYGLMLARLGRTQEATAQFDAVLTPAETHYNLASVYEKMGKKDDARAEYQKALEFNPKMRDAKVKLADLK